MREAFASHHTAAATNSIITTFSYTLHFPSYTLPLISSTFTHFSMYIIWVSQCDGIIDISSMYVQCVISSRERVRVVALGMTKPFLPKITTTEPPFPGTWFPLAATWSGPSRWWVLIPGSADARSAKLFLRTRRRSRCAPWCATAGRCSGHTPFCSLGLCSPVHDSPEWRLVRSERGKKGKQG